MTKENIKNKKGFTIIEVVLVLAIAGLIFLMVFIALPALQRSQRDTQRRQNYANMDAAIISSATNNNGTLLADGNYNVNDYIKVVTDASGTQYGTFSVKTLTSGTTISDNNNALNGKDKYIRVYKKAKCDNTTGKPTYYNNLKAFVVFGFLETGTQPYCYSGTI